MIDDYCKTSAYVRRKTGHDSAGKAVLGPAVEVPCRVQYGQQLVRGQAGQTSVSQVQLFVSGSVEIDIRDEVALTSPCAATLPVLQVRRRTDLDGDSFLVVFLGG